jgi:AcrR family transcriptional regulator
MTLFRAVEFWRQLSPKQVGSEGMTKLQRTRRRILGHAMRLFAEQGYGPTTAIEISAAAGVSRATFFLHFPTKAALLGELSREIAELWQQEEAPERETGLEALLRFFTFLFRETDFNAIGYAILVDFLHTYGADMSAGSGVGTLHHHVEQMVLQAQEEGEWSRQWSADAVAHFLIQTYNQIRGELSALAPKDAASRLMSLVSNGLSEVSR